MASGNLAAFLGAFWTWCAVIVGVVWYEVLVTRRPLAEVKAEAFRAAVQARLNRLYWFAMVVIAILPGLWIGITATSPVPIVAAYWLTGQAIRLLIRVIPPSVPRSPASHQFSLVLLVRSLGMLLGATFVGVCIRALFQS
jgi:hypothetical protein